MKRVHYIDNYLVNPQHPVTVNLIGAGGTGSQVLTCLARLDAALRGLGHPGLFVTLYDPDIVTEANIGRQLFGPSDLGQNKAQCLVTRINNFFGNDWKAQPDIYPTVLKDARRDNLANITITCTDNIKSRIDLWNLLKALPQPAYCTYETPLSAARKPNPICMTYCIANPIKAITIIHRERSYRLFSHLTCRCESATMKALMSMNMKHAN